ncbi:receptor-like protein 7 isoform X3 [Rhodamnia argentea]|uniref:Receptor-like protein 7 isoform X3 n=1 Tax=Rhodamnia argentea TaxID=178133 RepID=A0ABM3GTN7_9MYRT|nr:receptor-like protein 7 isoform X3 [Rhodamnia argentea]
MCYTHKICLEQMRIWLLLWLVLILAHTNTFSIGTALVSGQCLGDQKSLLLELKNSLNFSASLSTKLIEWNPSNDSWDGVTCEGGQVTGLDLSSESITGVLDDSSSLFRLNHLQRLNLAYNSFQSSEIPSGFGNLTDLVYLNLSNAGFVGQVPIGISRLTRLVTLDVSLLYFPGLTSLKLENPNLKMLVANLSELRELYLDGVNVSATGNELCNALSSSLPKLQVLSMVNCYLSGPIESCSSLMNLRSLSVIKLGNNNLSSTVPEFFSHFHNLTTLHLSSCGLQGEFPQKIFQVQTLRTLDLSVNKLLQGSLPGFPENGSLQRLVLSFTNISGRLPESIANLRSLSRIELVNCSFHGNIPSSFTNLSQLTYLDFSFNNFTGSIPSLSKSENLTRIDLSHNNLTGQIDSMQWEYLLSLLILDLRFNLLEGNIPSSLFTLPSIQKLLLSNNRFSGQVKGSFNATSHMLNTLDLSNNNIGGELPVFIWELRGLKYLSLSSSNFSGSFHINLVQQLRNLSYLDLSYNRFSINATNTASQASSFPDLATLKLSSCQLRTLPEFLAEQHRLVSLDLSDNQIQGELPKWIWELQNLLYLNLSSNLLDDIDTLSHNLTSTLSVLDLHKNRLRGQTLPLPPFATHMDFSSNNFTLVILPAIGTSLSVAIFFSLSNNNIQGFIPKSICEAEYLQVLDLSHNNLSGNIPDCLVMGPLKVLNLRNNALDGSIFNFPETCGLKTLDISSNRLQGKFPKSMANCTTLEVLDVGDNQIDDVFPCELKSIASLRVLVLRSNNFHGGVGCPEFNGNWTMLQIIDISSNNFRGTLPAQWLTSWVAMKANVDYNHIQFTFLRFSGLYYQDTVSITVKGLQVELVKILTLFTSIDFSCNDFEGPIPETFGALKALYVLNLSTNAFSGPIPSSLGHLQQLESLDLSWNDLDGTIPAQLSDLNFLSFLNLSYNKLEGSIPAVKQFLTFSANSFKGNSGLCGPQLGIKCSNTNSSEHGKNDSDGWGSINFQFILVGLGFGAGAAVVVAPLTFWKTGQEWYDDQVDKLLEVVLPKMGFTYTRHHDDNSEGDEAFETSSTAILCSYSDYEFDEEEENEEEESWGRYCVFCSKLDLSVKKVIHDPKCTCYDSPPMSSSSSYSSSSSA